MNEQSKPWWQSKAIIGAVVTVGAVIFGFFGVTIDEDTKSVMINEAEAIISAVVIIVGAVGSVWGRLKADKKIGKG